MSNHFTTRDPVASTTINGVTFYARKLDLKTRLETYNTIKGRKDGEDLPPEYFASLLVACVCDEAGKPLMTPEQIPDIVSSNSEFIQPMLGFVLDLNGLTDKAKDDAKKN